jgi:hypothetical protein
MRLLHLIVLVLAASSLAACTVSSGDESSVPEPNSVSEIATTESTLEDDRDLRDNASAERSITPSEREAAERLAHTAESARVQPSE